MLQYIILGIVIGVFIGAYWSKRQYHEVLLVLSRLRSPEKIGQHFYYIVPEHEYVSAYCNYIEKHQVRTVAKHEQHRDQ